MSRNVAQVMVDQLVAWGVQTVFGVVGDGNFYFLDALARRKEIKFFAVRHEETAALMASAHAKLTGKMVVCTGTTGPGTLHLLNGLADAQIDGVPVLVISGQVARKDIGTEKKQYLDQQTIIRPLVAYSSLLADPKATLKVLTKAYKSALSQRMPAQVTVPMDVFSLPCDLANRPPEPYLFTKVTSEEEVLQEALGFFKSAQRPLILAGVGAREASQPVVELAEKWGAGVIHTLGGIGVIPAEHPLALGGLGHAGSNIAQQMLAQADVCFRIGVNWWPQDYIPKDITILELDSVPANIGSASPVSFGLVGDAEELLPRITAGLPRVNRPDWHSQLAQAHTNWHQQVEKEVLGQGEKVPPARLVDALHRVVEPNAVICLDTGDHTIWFGRNFRAQQQRILLSGKWRTMGFGLPAALAAKLAQPGRQVVALVGDGGMGMVLAEFTTAIKYNLPVVIVVVNNGGLIEEKNRMQTGNLIPLGVHLHNPDFALFARACGGEGFTIEKPEQLDAVLTQALKCGKPAIVDVLCDPTTVPGTKIS